MQLGNFSVSLAVKDLQKSRAFYQKLGFEAAHGNPEQGWVVLRNDQCVIGLFQDMFTENILTFNPGWNIEGETLSEFTDIRELQSRVEQQGIDLVQEIDADSTGPASFVIQDPDGNTILIDQHV